ncbi:histidine phosphatase family protein [Pectobacterium aroidearum]|uniref:histidine phosphatase family protein n=1 Tax=Pectobacterium aroidearum TaxID=1201031 RepID=UPI0015F69FF7|nr:histidine phosphatase family protein [Pectobacterium aroidearum]MBA5600921.1 histidine phosphatase family protein [Pectobacterium aroidearum]
MKLILVRHAETEWNLKGIIQGHCDSSLTRRGLRETSALLDSLTESEYQVERVYASPLGRAWQMGQNLAEYFRCSLTAEPALKEQAFGQFEGMPLELLRQKHPNDANALFRLDAEYCPPGGESLAHASQRVIRFVQSLEDTSSHHQTICIVSHGHVSQGILAMFKEGTVKSFARYAQPNASYSVIDLINGKCIDLRWGIATHLRQLER